jgi:hypothetical protein
MKSQDIGERHGFSVEIALDEAAFRVAEEFDLFGCLHAFANGGVAQFVAEGDEAWQEDSDYEGVGINY